jgi:NTP pyrophosphatase (non-canonical NTP hydrolase)
MDKKQSELFLKQQPTLKDYQQYVRDLVEERGFKKESIPEIFMLLSEEIGEMAKAARKCSDMKVDASSRKPVLELEIADVFVYLLDICNQFDIDLEKAFRDKEKINKKRTWN